MLSDQLIFWTRAYARTKGIRTVFVFLFTVFFVISSATDAPAYIDPNTGGYIFQLFFPVISVIAFVYLFLKRQVKMLFTKIIHFFKRILSKISASVGVSRGDIGKGSD